jgi:hypothetical protein
MQIDLHEVKIPLFFLLTIQYENVCLYLYKKCKLWCMKRKITDTISIWVVFLPDNYTLYKNGCICLILPNDVTTDNILQILLQASRWRVKTANTIVT